MTNEVEIGDLIDSIQEVRVRRALLEKEAKACTGKIELLEHEIIKMLSDLKLDTASSNGVTVSPRRETYPHVENWDLFGEFILANKYLHLLERRPTVLAYRELLDLGREVPGVVPFVKTRLSVRIS